jgi:hypothetical protein
MENNITRDSILDCLTQNWGEYVSKIKGLEDKEQRLFLKQQGYARLLDLLAHITAWWQDGMQKVAAFQQDANYQPPAVNVDVYNAAAVKSVKDRSEEAVIDSFETTRLQFIELAQMLSDADLKNPKITRQLEMEIIGHYQEHKIN